MNTKQINTRFALFIVFALILSILIGLLLHKCGTVIDENEPIVQSDTIRVSDTLVIRDTIRIKEPEPYYVEVVRTDTLVFRDTVKVPIPIEQKTYKTDYYKAVIEGYKPTLLSMDVFNKTLTIRDTVRINNTITKFRPPRWVVSIGPGVGYGPKGFEPYIGLNVGFVIWSK